MMMAQVRTDRTNRIPRMNFANGPLSNMSETNERPISPKGVITAAPTFP